MLDGFRGGITFKTGVIGQRHGFRNCPLVIAQSCAKAGAQLGERDPRGLLQKLFIRTNLRRTGTKDSVVRRTVDRISYDIGMDVVLDLVVSAGWDVTVFVNVRLDVIEDLGSECKFHVSTTSVNLGIKMGDVTWLKRFGQKLRGEEKEMVAHQQLLGLSMEVIDRRFAMASKRQSQGSVLNFLKFGYRRGLIIRIYDGSGIA